MLVSLMVKNLALIESAEVTFGKGLNILSGETGAGKSILMGSVNMALGGKVSRDVIRTGADYAYAWQPRISQLDGPHFEIETLLRLLRCTKRL